jgi:hypothetical protein
MMFGTSGPSLIRQHLARTRKTGNYLRQQVCAGNISLPDAQREITTNWFAVYQRMNSEEAR